MKLHFLKLNQKLYLNKITTFLCYMENNLKQLLGLKKKTKPKNQNYLEFLFNSLVCPQVSSWSVIMGIEC